MEGRCAAGPTQVLRNRCTLSQEDRGTSWKGPPRCKCSAGENEALVFSIAYRLAAAVLSLQRCINTGISILKEVVTLKMERDSTILIVMSLSVFIGACCGTSLLMWTARAMNVQQVPPGLSEAEINSLRNTLALWREQAQEMQELRDKTARLAAEISTMTKEFQQMTDAMSANMGMSDWALKMPGAAIDLQKSPSSGTGFCRVFWFLCAPPRLDSFVQPDTSPGYCWPFRGSRSEVLIRLPTQIQPTAVVIQHTSKAAIPLETVSSAPRDITVYGLDKEGEEETLLGRFTYTVKREPPQTFPLQNGIPRAFQFLKLVVQSNWGKPGYTCIYRVWVHGKIVESNATGQTQVKAFPQ
ncbi:sperm-associated antigen 4 protein [Columba livia]|uniref:sperm-associated antigen 4 protein n=1 Tax=Columba livia TaxID=8932 RepID=UPI000A3961B7|nr:sperm-associated antigen 4 protein-like isoform X2 [Columba livia]